MKIVLLLNPVELVLEEAKKYLGLVESPRLSNRATEIDFWLKECHVPFGNPWCAAFVTGVIRQALGRGSPVYLNASVQRIVEWAESLRTIGVWQDKPEIGDLFVIYFDSLKRFGHVGFVSEIVSDTEFKTVEGNSNSDGSRDGYGVVSNKRKITNNIKFIRWANALPDSSKVKQSL